ncbi:MAG: HAMP domain-containing protein [Desulfobacterales bacterium]|nr:HAMP domain-containing protein [Desulfobacterales bacterium]
MLKQFSIRTKLIITFGISLIGLWIVGVGGYFALKKNAGVATEVKQEKFLGAMLTEKTYGQFQSMVQCINASAMLGTDQGLKNAQKKQTELLNYLKSSTASIRNDTLSRNLSAFNEKINQVYILGEKKVKAVIDQDFVNIPTTNKAFEEATDKLLSEITQLQKITTDDLKQSLEGLVVLSNTSAYIGISIMLGIFVITLLCSILVYRSISQPIHHLGQVVISLASGELNTRSSVQSQDEIGQLSKLLNGFIETLRDHLHHIIITSDQLNTASSDISAISAQLASSSEIMNKKSEHLTEITHQISENVNTTASAAYQAKNSVTSIANMSEQMSSTFDGITNFSVKTTDNVKDLAKSVQVMSEGLDDNASSIEEMTSSLNQVAQHISKAAQISERAIYRTDNVNFKMDALTSASKQIDKIVLMIKKIADRTNLLALNATIEAVGAGEAGKSFGVVATAIKDLAKQSAAATGEIADLIQQIQHSTKEAVQAIQEINSIIGEIAALHKTINIAIKDQTLVANEISKRVSDNAGTVKNMSDRANESSNFVGEIAKSTHDVFNNIKELSRDISQISNSSNDVAKASQISAGGVKEISQHLKQILDSANHIANASNQTRDASQELAIMSTMLSKMVRFFKL